MLFWICLCSSFALVAFGQASWVPHFGIGAAAFGFAIFWRAMRMLPKRRDRFWLAFGWFAVIQAIQISWMSSTQYMGPLILVIFVLLVVALGAQFGLLSFFFCEKELSLADCLAGAGCWVFLEWSRHYPLSGFAWNPVGLALADSSLSLQFASLLGIYGLSFWVIFVNLFALDATTWRKRGIWALLALFPYLFGMVHQLWIEHFVPKEREISAVLVQTALLPEQKDLMMRRTDALLPPLNQWERVFATLPRDRSFDLLVLPEAAISMSAYSPSYPIALVEQVWIEAFGEGARSALPPLEPPFVMFDGGRGKKGGRATNAFIAQALANYFRAHVIAGFDDHEGKLRYNAAFSFHPGNHLPQRYEKRVLVPIGEYTPFRNIEWFSLFLVEQFGVGDSFDPGREAKIFSAPLPIGVSICLEETYGGLVRELRGKGAELLVNISNDVWFPRSRLPDCHFQHGRIRAAENGVYVLRCCNTGVTGGIDCFGGVIGTLPPSEQKSDALYLHFSLRSFRTLYTWWGDGAILCLSACFVFFWLRKKKLLLNSSLR